MALPLATPAPRWARLLAASLLCATARPGAASGEAAAAAPAQRKFLAPSPTPVAPPQPAAGPGAPSAAPTEPVVSQARRLSGYSYKRFLGPGENRCRAGRLLRETVDSEAACEEACSELPNCWFYSYWQLSGMCRLTAECKDLKPITDEESGEAVVIAAKVDEYSQISQGHVKCDGDSLLTREVLSQTQCAAHCSSTDPCKYYSYCHSTGTCVLTETCTTSTGNNLDSTIIYMKAAVEEPITIEEPVPTTSLPVGNNYVFVEGPSGKRCKGDKVFRKDGVSQAACEELCSDYADCAFYSFWANNGRCRLTESCTETVQVADSESTIVIYRKVSGAPMLLPANEGWQEIQAFTRLGQGFLCPGATLASGPTAGVVGCSDWCLKTPSCAFFSLSHDSVCGLFSTCDNPMVDQLNDVYMISELQQRSVSLGGMGNGLFDFGIDSSSSADKQGMESVLQEGPSSQYCGAMSLSVTEATDLEACEDACKDTPHCFYYSFWETKQCRLTETCSKMWQDESGIHITTYGLHAPGAFSLWR